MYQINSNLVKSTQLKQTTKVSALSTQKATAYKTEVYNPLGDQPGVAPGRCKFPWGTAGKIAGKLAKFGFKYVLGGWVGLAADAACLLYYRYGEGQSWGEAAKSTFLW